MNFQRYIGAFVFLLSGLGIFNQYDTVKPNQEIVIQFQKAETELNNVEAAIVSVKEKLEAIGVQNLHVSHREGGVLKISYFSNRKVSEIKHLMLSDSGFKLRLASLDCDDTSRGFPIDGEDYNDFKLKVHEIQKGNNDISGCSGKSILIQKSDLERFLNPNYVQLTPLRELPRNGLMASQAASFYKYTLFVPNQLFYNLPETRAGPIS